MRLETVSKAGNTPWLSDALELYLKLKGFGKDKVFIRTATRNVEYAVKVLGWVTIQSLRSDIIITIAEFLNGRKFVIGNQMLDVWPKAYRLITRFIKMS